MKKIPTKEEIAAKVHRIRHGAPPETRGRVIAIPLGARCAICGVTKPLDTAHLIPQRFFRGVKGADPAWLHYDGRNTVILCKNHHTLYDRYDLDWHDFLILWPRIEPLLDDFSENYIAYVGGDNANAVASLHRQMIGFITKFNAYA